MFVNFAQTTTRFQFDTFPADAPAIPRGPSGKELKWEKRYSAVPK
jgi:hypothetical protein